MTVQTVDRLDPAITEVLVMTGVVPKLAVQSEVQRFSWGSPTPIPNFQQRYPVGSELSIVLVNGRDVGDLHEPGLHDWWFDRFFLSPVDEGVLAWLPDTTEVWPRRRGRMQLMLHNVHHEHHRLTDGGLFVGEVRQFEELLRKRLNPEADCTIIGDNFEEAFASDPGTLVAVRSEVRGDTKYFDLPVVSNNQFPRQPRADPNYLYLWHQHPSMHDFLQEWTFTHYNGVPYVVPRAEQNLAQLWVLKISSPQQALFWSERKAHIVDHQDEWLVQIWKEIPRSVWLDLHLASQTVRSVQGVPGGGVPPGQRLRPAALPASAAQPAARGWGRSRRPRPGR